MKIDGTSISPVGGIQAANRISQIEKQRRNLGEDQANVSEKGQFYQTLLQKAKELPEVREDRVQEITRQIEQGEFKVDSHQIARSLIFGLEK